MKQNTWRRKLNEGGSWDGSFQPTCQAPAHCTLLVHMFLEGFMECGAMPSLRHLKLDVKMDAALSL
jgi:hypothetical protein